jgi:hypothetical protein
MGLNEERFSVIEHGTQAAQNRFEILGDKVK